jgi:protein-disulfide isomerase
MKRAVDALLTAILVGCALIATGLVVRREFFATAPALGKSVFVKDWRDDLDRGVRSGGADAPVQLIEFADFECPFCAELHRVLAPLRQKYPMQIGLTYVHFPLPGHRFAIPAARAAECAGKQGRFEAMHDKLFEQQGQFGLKPWTEMAKEADVPDIATFDSCINRSDPIPRVMEGQALGKALAIQGTPTVIINGWKLGRPPTLDELDHMVKAILAGESPVGST